MADELKIGTTYAGIKAFSALTTPVKVPSVHLFYPYAKLVTTGDGAQRGVGLPYVSWYWRAITRPERDQLRTFCTGASAGGVYIFVPTNDTNNTYAYFTGTMLWPLGEQYYQPNITDLQIIVRQLVAYTP